MTNIFYPHSNLTFYSDSLAGSDSEEDMFASLADMTRSSNKRNMEAIQDKDSPEVRALKAKIRSLSRQQTAATRQPILEEEQFNMEGTYVIGPHDHVSR